MLANRIKERNELLSLTASEKSEFVAIYGRRRVGKTFLIRETFKNNLAFQHTGINNENLDEQLLAFSNSMRRYGRRSKTVPKNWTEAFFMLEQLLEKKGVGKKVIFIDELPWMDTPKSNFVSALDHFWNGWANTRNDILLIVCGSATSWIISKIVKNYGGLHNRLTRQIHLAPFNLYECEQYAQERHLSMTRRQILETYMVIGGIPFYWDCLKKELSWAQNIDNMFFQENAPLRYEFDALYASLFRAPQPYIDVVTILGTKKTGMTRDEIMKNMNRDLGGKLSDVLRHLDECDFIRTYTPIGKKKKDTVYQLIDNYTLFYFRFICGKNINEPNYWSRTITKQQYSVWSGLAFERVCFWHISQIKKALGISGIISNVHSWVYRPKDENETGAQVDMLIDRDDKVINLCEMKFSQGEFELTEKYDLELRNRMSIFQARTKTRKGVSTVMITAYGLKPNAWANDIQQQVTMDDLFEK